MLKEIQKKYIVHFGLLGCILGSNWEGSGLKFACVETGMDSGWNYVGMDFRT